MKFKFSIFFFFVFFSVITVSFPQRSEQDIKTQQALINKINQSPRNPDHRFELAATETCANIGKKLRGSCL
jgi:hypothetical protein